MTCKICKDDINQNSVCGGCYGYKRFDWKENLRLVLALAFIGLIILLSL